jgi:hypothetical protein
MVWVDFIIRLELDPCSALILKLALLLKKLEVEHRPSDLVNACVVFVFGFEVLPIRVLKAQHLHWSVAFD